MKNTINKAKHFDSVSKEIETRLLSSNTIFESMGTDFLTMDFDMQSDIINACLINYGKYLNSKQTINESKIEKHNSNTYSETKTYRDSLVFLFNNHDEIFNSAWIECMEMVYNPKYYNLPLPLFVSKASGKAFRKEFYWNCKYNDETVDAETMVNCADSILGYESIFDNDRIDSILSYVRNDLKEKCKQTISLLVMGYNYKEIAEIMQYSELRIYKYVSAISNAIAIVNALDKEWAIVDSIIASETSERDTISRETLEQAIIKEYQKEFKVKLDSVITWRIALDRLKDKAYYTSSQNSLAKAFYKK